MNRRVAFPAAFSIWWLIGLLAAGLLWLLIHNALRSNRDPDASPRSENGDFAATYREREQQAVDRLRSAHAGPQSAGSRSAPSSKRSHPPADTGPVFQTTGGGRIPIEVWGDSYETYERSPPLKPITASIRITHVNGKGELAVDPPRKRLFLMTRGSGVNGGRISVINYDGSGMRTVLDNLPELLQMTVDWKHERLYWANAPGGRSQGYAIQSADLDGRSPTTIGRGLEGPGAIAVDHEGHRVYCVENGRIVVIPMEGGRERVAYHQMADGDGNAGHATFDPTARRLYWGTEKNLWRGEAANIQTERVRIDPIPILGGATAIMCDAGREVYWADLHGICRSDIDGRYFERIVDLDGGLYCSAAADFENRLVFWTAQDRSSVEGGPIPLPPKKIVVPAPPIIERWTPAQGVKSGDTLRIEGRGFLRTLSVACVGDAEGRHVPADFLIASESELHLRVPKFSADTVRFTVIVRTENGVTVTLPRDTVVVARVQSFDLATAGLETTYYVPRGGWLSKIEERVVYVAGGGLASPYHRGAVVFLKNGAAFSHGGSQENTVYREPFTDVTFSAQGKINNTYIDVPAIRPSFVQELPVYRP